ncbi:hypothetical protein [uncultured Nostoc sp.]|uniref:hypothetical protein n=1 Tax=uncultured Nostoc sp. TaxID=340711 RepID=UPI0035CA1D48
MFERFFKKFDLTSRPKKTTELKSLPSLISMASGAKEFLTEYSGSTFNDGLYRVYKLTEIEEWTVIVENTFPDFKGRIICFAYDWLGRQFTLDSNRIIKGEPLILMFDVGSGEVVETTISFQDLHNLIVDYPNEILASDFFAQWRLSVGYGIERHQCIGYKIPLFLNGKEELSNLEINSMKLYWELLGKILEQVRQLPPGTKVTKIEIQE